MRLCVLLRAAFHRVSTRLPARPSRWLSFKKLPMRKRSLSEQGTSSSSDVALQPHTTPIDTAQRKALAERPQPDFLGVEPSLDILRWIWDSGIVAVAGDAPSFEQAPIAGAHTTTGGAWNEPTVGGGRCRVAAFSTSGSLEAGACPSGRDV